MKCPHCDEEMPVTANFCEVCGGLLRPMQNVSEDTQSEGGGLCLHHFEDGFCLTCGKQEVLDWDVSESVGDTLCAISHRGIVHEANEDAVAIKVTNDGTKIMVVCDGVSSAIYGAQASKEAAEVSLNATADFITTGMEAKQAMRAGVALAHQRVLEISPGEEEKALTTLVMACVKNNKASVAWVGDSRAYLLRGRSVIQATEDDSYMSELLKQGMDVATAMKDRNAHAITQCLGMKDQRLDVHVADFDIGDDTRVMLCTDGFWNCFMPEHLPVFFEALRESTPKQTLVKCVQFAHDKGGLDNITLSIYTP
jgi:PPM family protein phosphatase